MYTRTRPLAIIDVESGGLDVNHDEIIEIAVVRAEVDGSRTSRVRRIKPSRPISPESTAIHGIRDTDVENEPNFAQIAPGLIKLIDGCDIGGFNVTFDLQMLSAHFHRAGIDWTINLERIVDIGNMFKVMEKRDLATAVLTYCGREHVGAHGALPDVNATLDVMDAMITRYPRFQGKDAEEQIFLASRYDGPPPVDIGGKLTRDADGDITFTFGKEKGTKIRNNPGYARWMLRSDFPPHTCQILRDELRRLGLD